MDSFNFSRLTEAYLRAQTELKNAAHIDRFVSRGGPRLHPSDGCIRRQCIKMLQPSPELVEYATEKLYLFEFGHTFEAFARDVIFGQYEPFPFPGNGGIMGHSIPVEHGLWSGEVDIIYQVNGDKKRAGIAEVKTTKGYAIDRYYQSRPGDDHIRQVAAYQLLCSEVFPSWEFVSTHVVYIPNNVHPEEAWNNGLVKSIEVHAGDWLDVKAWMGTVEAAVEAVGGDPGNLPAPSYSNDEFPCAIWRKQGRSWSDKRLEPICPFYEACHGDNSITDSGRLKQSEELDLDSLF